MKTKRLIGTQLTRGVLALSAIAVASLLQWFPVNALNLDERMRDQFIQLQASSEPESRLVIIDIDEASLAKIGPWPWPRTRLAELIEVLIHDYAAKGIALDMVFPEVADPEGDQRLAQLARTQPLVFAQVLDYVERPTQLHVGALSGGEESSPPQALPLAIGYIGNYAKLNAPHTGNIGFVPDSDGTIRRLPLFSQFAGHAYPALSVALLGLGEREAVRITPQGVWQRIAFSRKLSAYTVIPSSEVLNLKAPAVLIADKLVLVGSSSLGLADTVATPLLSNTSGVFVHAAMLTSLLDRTEGRAPAPWPGKWLAVLFSIGVILVSMYTLTRRSALLNAFLLITAGAIWLLLAYCIAPHDAAFSITAPLVSFMLLVMVAIPYHWQLSQRKSRQLLDTLNHYVAPVVVNELLSSKLEDPLAPRRHTMTTLVADMEGYTKHIEGMSLEEAATFTSQFLDCLTQPVLACRGTLDKYTGDGLVAFWGAPILDADHADRALDAALQIVNAVKRMNTARQRSEKPQIRVRIGIESGLAMSGDFGTSTRSIYTAVGDSVNTASRLQDAARNFPHNILLGQGAAALIHRHALIPLGEIQLRGKRNPTGVFTVNAID